MVDLADLGLPFFRTPPYLVGGIPTPLKNDGVKVSWDDEIPKMMGKYWKAIKFHGSSHHQAV